MLQNYQKSWSWFWGVQIDNREPSSSEFAKQEPVPTSFESGSNESLDYWAGFWKFFGTNLVGLTVPGAPWGSNRSLGALKWAGRGGGQKFGN